MADLDHFDDRTIKRAREQFTDGKRGSGDDPMATHSKVAQNVMLGHLRSLIARAESGGGLEHSGLESDPAAGLQGEIDGDSLIDPFLSYDENVSEIKREYGVDFKTYERAEREAAVEAASERAEKQAREALRENLEAIEAGDANELVRDIAEQYGQEFVAEVLGRERELLEAEPKGAPEPSAPEPSEPEPVSTSSAPEPEPSTVAEPIAPAARLEPTPEPERAPASVSSPAAASAPEPPASSVSAVFLEAAGELLESLKVSAKLAGLAIGESVRDL